MAAKFFSVLILTMLAIISGCNNPSGGSVISQNHAPLLQPPAPFSFSLIRASAGQVEIDWQASIRVERYEFYQGTSSSDISTLVPACSNTIETCTLTGLDPNTTYYFNVKAINAAGVRDVSAIGRSLAVGAFNITSSSTGDAIINLAWGNSNNATKYKIVYGTSSGVYTSEIPNVTSPYVMTGLTNGVGYFVRVVAQNEDNGYSPSANEINQQPFGRLNPPTGLVATASPSTISLDWTDSPGVTYYKVFRGTASGALSEIATNVLSSSFTDSSVSNGTSYFYSIIAYNGLDSNPSAEISARPIASFSLSSATANPGPGQATITWPAVTGAASFDLHYGTNPASLTSVTANVTSPTVVNGLVGGSIYYFKIVARNAVGAGTSLDSTNQLTVTPIAALLAPVGFTASATPGSIALNWTAVLGATNYKIYRGLTAGTMTLLTGAHTPNSYIDSSVSNGTTYFYAVSAFNGYDSPNSATLSVRPIGNFSLTTATVATFSSINLDWGSATGAASYDIRYGTSPGVYSNVSTGRTAPTVLTGLTGSTTYYIAISATNAVGVGASVLSNEMSVTTSSTNPTLSILSYPNINSANKAAYVVSGACSENTRIVTVNVGGVTATPTCTSLSWSATLNVTAVADSATVAIVATHVNSGGNSVTANRTVSKDATDPTVAITSSPAIRNSNKAAYTVSGTCSENTRTVSVVIGGVGATPVCTALAWTTTINATALSDSATISITADHTDAAGNNATQATVNVVKDTTNPTVAISSSPVVNNANKAAYPVSGTCSDTGESVVVNVGATSATVTCTLLTWSASLNVTANADSGTLVVTADHTDDVGNSAVQAGTSVVKDTVNPTVTIASAPVINNANKAAYPVSGTCSENSRAVSVSVGGVTSNPTCTALSWSASLNVTAVADGGAISVTANHTDSAGNNAVEAATTVVKNTLLPTVTILSAPIINNTNKAAYPVSGACSENTRIVTVSVGGVSATPTCSGLAWSASLNVTAVADGASISVTADHTDSVGNNAVQASTTVLKDVIIPTVAITSSPVINNSNKAAYPISGTCSENSRTVSVNVGGVTATPTCSTLTWSASLNVTGVADNASVAATANHTDAAGNAATQATAAVVKDTVIPTVAITSSPAINNANRAAYTLSGSCSENTRAVSVNVGGISATPTCTALAWTATLNVTTVSDGASIAVTADHIDAAGNAAVQATTLIVKDTTNPTVAITSSPVINNTNKSAYPVSGTCSDTGQTVVVNVGATSSSVSCSLLTWSATLNVSANADSGTLLVTADHTDAVGNTAVQAGTTVVKDTAIPTVAITSSPVINNANKSAYPISGTCSENTRSVSVNVGGITATPTCTALSWSASLNVTSVSDSGAVSVTANHSDSAGNNAIQASLTVVKSTNIPTVTITSSPIINDTNKAAYTVSGACSENTRVVSVNVGGVTATPTCSTLAWSATLNVTGVADGASVAISADHTDAAGNNAVQATTSVLKDVLVPTVAISSAPIINNSNRTAYVVSGNCSENSRTVSVNVGGVTGSPVCTALAWSTTLNVTGVSDSATVSVTANHTDAAGNAAVQAATTVVKDVAIPTVAITSSPIINNANRATYVVSGTCSENTRTVSVSVGGVAATPTCTTLTWSATLNVTGVSDGASVAILADHSDASGNNAVQATATVLKDVVIPTVAITSSTVINNTNKAAYPVSGTCSENTRTVSVNVGGVTASPTCSALAWSATVNVTGIADGAAITMTADHSDAAGNPATQSSVSVVKDTVIPTVTITSSPAINDANQSAYPVSGTCSENTRVVSVNVGGVSATPTCTALAWSASLNVSGVSDGPAISITANHSDASGNASTQASTTVIKNSSLPTVSIAAASAINNANKAAYPVSGTCSENTRTVTVNVGGVSATPTCSSLAWSTTVDVTAVGDGASIAITANHTDSVGNNAIQATTSALKDVIIPTVVITSSPVINNTNKAAYPISGTCSENTRTVTINVGGVTATPTCSSLTWSASLNVAGVSDSGSVTVTANHSDLAGNSATQASTTVVKDVAVPTVAITSSPAINNINKAAYPLSGTCSENTRVVTVNVGGVSATPTCSSLTWSASLNVTGVSDSGSVAITADHSDASLNNAVQATASVIKDVVIPTVAISSSPAINNTNKAAYPISGTCSENTSSVIVNVGGVSATPTCTTLTWSASLNLTAVSDGASIAVTADHSDAAGNAAVQASTTVVKDVAVPTVAITSSTAINNANKAAYPVSGTCSENTRTVNISVGGVTATPTCTALAWSASVNVTAVSDSSSITMTANHTDASGNAAVQASTTVLKDVVIPTVAITSSPAINNANKATYPISGTCSENTRSVSVTVAGVSSTPSCSSLVWAATLDLSAISDSGSISAIADHTDAALNNATQATATIVKDTSLPTVAITSSPIINNANKTVYPVSGTCSENTRTVTVNVGGISATPTCTALAWSATMNVAGVSDNASVAITADHSDTSGNSAVQATATVLKDTSNPSVAISSSPSINFANRAAYTVSGTCSENTRTVSVSVGGITATPICSTLAWSATLNVTALVDSGSVAITADHTDAAANTATQATASVIKDATAPTVAITAPAAINNTNKASYPVSGTCSENTRVVTINVGGVSATPTCTALAWSTSVNVTAVADSGSVAITADHIDAAGNAATQATASALKDTVIPTVAITSSPLINNVNKAAYPVSGTCSENTRTVSVSVGGVAATPTCTSLAWSASVNVTGVADGGAIAITANHTDAVGNSAVQASTTVVKDTSVPTVAITSSPAINNTNKAAYPISGTCSENTRVVTVSVGGVSATPTCTSLAWSASVNVTAVADGGSIAITADHIDASGNSAVQATASVLKDTIIPIVAITSSPAINNGNRAAYPISGTCSENTRTVTVVVGGVSATPTCTSLAWSASLNVTAVADSASVAITANHSDAAGNAAIQATTTTVKDTSNPTVAITSSPVINNANKAAYTVSGTCSETGQTVTINVGSVNTTDTCTLLTWTKTVDVSGNPDSGTLLITADHVDINGNTAVQAGLTVVKDTAIPTVTIAAAAAINNTNRTAYTLTGTCSENTRVVSVNIGGVTASPTCTGLAWSTGSINVSAAADSATLSITANHTDSAGNNATTASTTVVKDTVIPTVTISSTPIINIANRTSYVVSGTCSENSRTVLVSVGGVTDSPVCTGLAFTTAAMNVNGVADGAAIAISANHSDASGNNANAASATALKDTVAPTIILSTSEPATTYSVSWTARATFSESVTGVAIGDYVIGNGTSSAFTPVSALIYDVTVTASAAGVVTVNMPASIATDAAGNPSTVAAQLSRTYALPAVLSYDVATTINFGSVNIGASADATILINKSGTANATAITEIGLAAPFAFKGGAFPGTGGTCTTTISAACTVVLTYTPTTAVVSNDAIQVQYNNGSSTQSITRNVTGTGVSVVATNISVSGPAGVMINQCVAYTINSLSASGTSANVTANQTVNLVVNNGTGTFFSNNTCATTATSTIITSGTSSRVIWFRSTTAAQFLTLVFNPTSLTSTSINVSTSNTPTRISFTTPAEMERNTCMPIAVNLVDAAGIAAGKSTTVQVNLNENGSAVFYSDSGCTGTTTTLNFAANQETKTVYVRNATSEVVNFSFVDNAGLLTTGTSTVTFVNFLTWWNSSYLKRLPIIINNQDQATAFTDIQVLVKLSPGVISYADTLANGADIRFTLSNHTTALSYEIESWNPAGNSFIWVKVPSIAASSNAIIYMYYNNTSATDGQNAPNTWPSASFSGIWNMKKSGASYIDSTGSGKTGTAVGTVTDLTGPIGPAISVASSSIDVGYNLALVIGRTSTFSFWVRTTVVGTTASWSSPGITGIEQSGGGNDIFFGWVDNTGRIGVQAGNGAVTKSNFIVNDNSWRHVTMSRNETTGAVRFYINGVLNGSGTSETGAKTLAFSKFGLMGNSGGGPLYFTGAMDGLRLKNYIETDARIRAEYKFSTSTNTSFSAVEEY